MLIMAMKYPRITLARKYAPGVRGDMRSCRVQPIERSAAMRAPLAMAAIVAAEPIMPTM